MMLGVILHVIVWLAMKFRGGIVTAAKYLWGMAGRLVGVLTAVIFYFPDLGSDIYRAVRGFVIGVWGNLAGGIHWLGDLFVTIGSRFIHNVGKVIEWCLGWL